MINSLTLFIGITLMYSTPLVFAALGGVVSERSGVTNLGIEGMMTIGAVTGATVGYYSGSAWAVFIWFFLYKTKWGLHIRAVGEHPAAADTMGIHVYVIRYLCVLVSGVLAGFGGAAMTLAIIPQFTPTAISGQGFIALAAVIFGKWTPHGAYGACLLFGAAQALTVTLGGGNFAVPSQILAMLPYFITIVILILFVGRSSAPKASGQPYEKGAR